MNIKHITILASLFCSQIVSAQDALAEPKKEPKIAAMLAAGNTWTYKIDFTVPDNVKFKPAGNVKPEKVAGGLRYTFTEKQKSIGLQQLDELDRPLPIVLIYIDDVLKKKQILDYDNGQLLYYGTFAHDPKEPENKIGHITLAPIPIYNKKAKVADTWKWTTPKLPSFEFRIISKDADITIDGKTYKADKIRMDQRHKSTNALQTSREYWFVENLGLVKEKEKIFVKGGKAIVKERILIKFSKEKK